MDVKDRVKTALGNFGAGPDGGQSQQDAMMIEPALGSSHGEEVSRLSAGGADNLIFGSVYDDEQSGGEDFGLSS